jgi:hypothetical protein
MNNATKTEVLSLLARLERVEVPAYSSFSSEVLWRITGAGWSTGLCREQSEALTRALAWETGGTPETEAPEMEECWAAMQSFTARDGGARRRAFEEARAAGIHTAEWAIASRYAVRDAGLE